METTVTSFDGKSKKAKLELNIETGEITYLKDKLSGKNI